MRGWLKLVGTADRPVPEGWAIERKDLLHQVRFSEANSPDPIARGDRLVLHAVSHQRLLAIVEVLDDAPHLDPAPKEWERQWPLILRVRPLVKVGRVSRAPSTWQLGSLPDLAHQSFVPLKPAQLEQADHLLRAAAAP